MSDPGSATQLTHLGGGETHGPSEAEVAAEIEALYRESPASEDSAEHRSLALRRRTAEGALIVLEADGLDDVRLEEWRDEDYTEAAAPPRRMVRLSQGAALGLFRMLLLGNVERLRGLDWETAG